MRCTDVPFLFHKIAGNCNTSGTEHGKSPNNSPTKGSRPAGLGLEGCRCPGQNGWSGRSVGYCIRLGYPGHAWIERTLFLLVNLVSQKPSLCVCNKIPSIAAVYLDVILLLELFFLFGLYSYSTLSYPYRLRIVWGLWILLRSQFSS